MNSMPEILPDDPVLLKQMLNKMLVQMLSERQLYKGQIVDLKEQVKLLRDRLFGRKSEQTVESDTPQLALFNEAESVAVLEEGIVENEEVVAPTRAVANANRCPPTCHASKSSTNCPNTN